MVFYFILHRYGSIILQLTGGYVEKTNCIWVMYLKCDRQKSALLCRKTGIRFIRLIFGCQSKQVDGVSEILWKAL